MKKFFIFFATVIALLSCNNQERNLVSNDVPRVHYSRSFFERVDSINAEFNSIVMRSPRRIISDEVQVPFVGTNPQELGGCWKIVQKDVDGALKGAAACQRGGWQAMLIGGLISGAVSSAIEGAVEYEEIKNLEETKQQPEDDSNQQQSECMRSLAILGDDLWLLNGHIDYFSPLGFGSVTSELPSFEVTTVGDYHNYLIRKMYSNEMLINFDNAFDNVLADSVVDYISSNMGVSLDDVVEQLNAEGAFQSEINPSLPIYEEVSDVFMLYKKLSTVQRTNYVQSLLNLTQTYVADANTAEYATVFGVAISTMHASASLWYPMVPEYMPTRLISVVLSNGINLSAIPVYDEMGDICRVYFYLGDASLAEDYVENNMLSVQIINGVVVDRNYRLTICDTGDVACLFIH